jgi:aspartyl/asparaginyl beta-hydroxylase (cupin superfamily)
MHRPSIDARALAQAGVEALRNGNARQARETFERIAAAGKADASTCLALAIACRNLGDHPAALAALDQALTLEPRNLRALVMKADQLAAAGDARAASSFYRAALNVAPPADQLPADLRSELGRAQSMCERYAADFDAYLRGRLEPQMAGRRATRRFLDSLDLLTGRKKIFLQEPRTFFFPELPQIQFYERNVFPWLDRLEAATREIRAELIDVLKVDSGFKPYIEGDPTRPQTGDLGLLNNPAWSAFYLWKHGEIVLENAKRCPKTMSALAGAPLAIIPKRSPSVMFSLLRPGAHIPPHTGETNVRLICHLPLVVPSGCTLRVGNATRALVEGQAWVFDDTIEHEARNPSDQSRVILLLEIWRPELDEEERLLVNAMFEAIDAYAGGNAHPAHLA